MINSNVTFDIKRDFLNAKIKERICSVYITYN